MNEPQQYADMVRRAKDALLDLYATYEDTEPFVSWWPNVSPALDALWDECNRLRGEERVV